MPRVFALAPAQAIHGALDYSKTDHAKIYKAGIQQVSETPFDCEADGLFQFLKEVQDRVDEMGWTTGILSITTGIKDDEEKEEDFINNYGTIPHSTCLFLSIDISMNLQHILLCVCTIF